MTRIDALVSPASDASRIGRSRAAASQNADDFRSALDQLSSADESVDEITTADEQAAQTDDDQSTQSDDIEAAEQSEADLEDEQVPDEFADEPTEQTDVIAVAQQAQDLNVSQKSGQDSQSDDIAKQSTLTSQPKRQVISSADQNQQKKAAPEGKTQPPVVLVPTQMSNANSPQAITITDVPITSIVASGSAGGLSADVGKSGQQQVNLPNGPDSATGTDINVARVARGLRNAVQQNGGTINIRLMPPELGVVRIAVTLQSGSVNATFQTDSESVTQLLQSQMTHLRSALQQQGLSIERIEAQTRQPGGATLQQQQQFGDSASDGRSKGQYQQQQRGGRQPGGRQPGSTWQEFAQSLSNTTEES